jgi:hypothetical protein
VCVPRNISRRVRSDKIRGCGTVGLVLLAITSSHFRAVASAVTEPTDNGAIETTIDPTIARQRPAAATGNPLWAIPLRLLNITRERPLFSPSRRPPAVTARSAAPAQPAVKPGQPDHPLLTLLGTIVGEHQGIGIFVDQNSKNVISLKTGQEHDGWTMRTVHDRETIFEGQHREVILALPARNAANEPVLPGGNSSATALPAGTWMDGDGQMISPPTFAKGGAQAPSPLPAATWTDGDGQQISPPTVQN